MSEDFLLAALQGRCSVYANKYTMITVSENPASIILSRLLF